jgi:ABC-type multidrug transport system fused ATPase/permease subunit
MQLPRPNGGPRRDWFVQLTLLACAELGALFCLALGIRHAFDAVLVGGPVAVQELGISWLVWGLALVLVSAIARGWQRPLGERFGQHYARRVRSRVLRCWLSTDAEGAGKGSPDVSPSPEAEPETTGRGSLLVRLLGDTTALSRWHGRVKARSIANVTALAVVTVALAVVAWPLALAAMGPLLFGLAAQWWVGLQLEARATHARQQRARMAASVARTLDAGSGNSADVDTRAVKNLDRRGRKLSTGMVDAAQASGALEGLGMLMTGGALVATLGVRTYLVGHGQASAGTVLLAALWVGQSSRPIHELARAQDAWRRARVSERNLSRFLARGRGVSGSRKKGAPRRRKEPRTEGQP